MKPSLHSAGSSPVTRLSDRSCAMSLTRGWDLIPPERGGRLPCAGDVVILQVTRPEGTVTGPPGWDRAVGNVFFRLIGPGEQDPVFRFDEECEWEIHGFAATGIGECLVRPSC